MILYKIKFTMTFIVKYVAPYINSIPKLFIVIHLDIKQLIRILINKSNKKGKEKTSE